MNPFPRMNHTVTGHSLQKIPPSPKLGVIWGPENWLVVLRGDGGTGSNRSFFASQSYLERVLHCLCLMSAL